MSHRSTDNEIIVPIVNMLRDRNFRVWIDLFEIDEEKSQDGFRRPISVGIQQSSCALLFTSEEYCLSDYCREEAVFFMKRFAKQPHRIIEIRLDQNEARNTLSIPPKSVCIDFWQFEAARDKKEEQYVALVDEIISQTRKAIAT